MFSSLLSSTVSNLTVLNALICTVSSLVLGLAIAFIYMHGNTYSKNFVVTLALLPAIVQVVIMMVNGNLGTGIAVAGTFSLVRFRSVPGSAREIVSIFFAMAIGLATGTGYITYAILVTIVIGAAQLILSKSKFGDKNQNEKSVKITIPESLDYSGAFDDIFSTYTKKSSLERVRTTNMGSLFELHYLVTLKSAANEKTMIDELRCRNGNLTISCSYPKAGQDEL